MKRKNLCSWWFSGDDLSSYRKSVKISCVNLRSHFRPYRWSVAAMSERFWDGVDENMVDKC